MKQYSERRKWSARETHCKRTTLFRGWKGGNKMGTKQRQGDNDRRGRVKILCCTAERQIRRLRFRKGDNRGQIGETGREMREEKQR